MVPSAVAKRVSSPPLATLAPGWTLVPRWRTMIEPDVTAWPSKALLPSRLAWDSRPFLVEPPPLVFDMSALLARGGLGRLLGGSLLRALDLDHLDGGVLLPVAAATAVSGLVLVLEHVDLVAGGLPDHLGGDAGVLEFLAPRGDLALGVDEEQRGEGDFALAVDALDVDDVAFANLGFLSARADD